jgi:hypothetical protein
MFVDLSPVCQAPVNSVTDTIKTIVTVITLPVAVLTFLLGYRQKDHERTLTYYHKVVVDESLPKIFTFFDAQIPPPGKAARDALEGVSSPEKAVPKTCTVTLASFSTGLFDLKDAITQRTALFDERITPEIEEEFEEIQDQASGWFNDVALYKRRDVQELNGILSQGQREIIRKLYRGQFRDSRRWEWLTKFFRPTRTY